MTLRGKKEKYWEGWFIFSLRSRRLEVVGTTKNGRARSSPCVSPSRAPVLSFARYFQAPATQANLFFSWLLLLRELRASIWRAAGVLPRAPVVFLGALIPLLSGAIMGVYETAGAGSTRFHIQTCYFKINSYFHSESCKHKAERPFRFFLHLFYY